MTLASLIDKSGIKRLIPDRLYLKLKYRHNFGKKLDLKHPVEFQEKIQWLKLYNRKPEMTMMVDKYLVKEYVSQQIGSEFIIPTLGVWEKFEDIDFNSLPDSFVLKCTHDSGGIIICRNKSELDLENARKTMCAALKAKNWYNGREWPYKNVKPRIIAEVFMTDKVNQDLIDYKFYCFNGEPKYCQVIKNRSTIETIDFFDMDWNHQPFIGLNPNAIHSESLISKPHNMEKMIEIASILSKKMPFVRIDLYEINNSIYFGEITFYPSGGIGRFSPSEYNTILGGLINLPI